MILPQLPHSGNCESVGPGGRGGQGDRHPKLACGLPWRSYSIVAIVMLSDPVGGETAILIGHVVCLGAATP